MPFLLKHEGRDKVTNNPNDPGGWTKWGITLRYLKAIGSIDPKDGFLLGDMDHDGDIDYLDIQLMTEEEATKIYKTQWWDRYKYGQIENLQLAAKVFDFAVNAGAKQAGLILQRAYNGIDGIDGRGGLRLVEDGILGPKSFGAVNLLIEDDPQLMNATYKLLMVQFYNGLKKEMFLSGWINRALDDLEV